MFKARHLHAKNSTQEFSVLTEESIRHGYPVRL